MLITATSLSPPTSRGKDAPGTASGYLFPDAKFVSGIPIADPGPFMRSFLLPESDTTTQEASGSSGFEVEGVKRSFVFVCGHGSRDARCGQIAPLLVDEFEKVLAQKGLLAGKGSDGGEDEAGKYEVGVCSHIGGHVVSTDHAMQTCCLVRKKES